MKKSTAVAERASWVGILRNIPSDCCQLRVSLASPIGLSHFNPASKESVQESTHHSCWEIFDKITTLLLIKLVRVKQIQSRRLRLPSASERCCPLLKLLPCSPHSPRDAQLINKQLSAKGGNFSAQTRHLALDPSTCHLEKSEPQSFQQQKTNKEFNVFFYNLQVREMSPCSAAIPKTLAHQDALPAMPFLPDPPMPTWR